MKSTITYPYESDLFGVVELKVAYEVEVVEHDSEGEWTDVHVTITSVDWGLDNVTPVLSQLGEELITDFIKENL